MFRLAQWLVLIAAISFLAQPNACCSAEQEDKSKEPKTPQIKINEADLKPLHKEYKVWIDPVQKWVVMEGEVCLTKGFLEMFACLKGTKEHESIVTIKTEAKIVHAGLLAIGAKPGTTVQFRPTYKPATGQQIEIYVLWNDPQGQSHQARAQDWIRDVKKKQAMSEPWVFAGSGFWKDDDGQEHYRAESGDFICVSNFPGAMLDLPVQSSDQNDDLTFDAFTERIPEKGTKVKLVLIPKLDPAKKATEPPAPSETQPRK